MLSENGIKREDVFITNIVKHVSPQNRKPYPDEVAACLPYLNMQISIIKPKIIVLLGASAKETPRLEGIEYIQVIHPSAAMRFTKMSEKFREQIAELAKQTKNLNSNPTKKGKIKRLPFLRMMPSAFESLHYAIGSLAAPS